MQEELSENSENLVKKTYLIINSYKTAYFAYSLICTGKTGMYGCSRKNER
jgi:hypothetical protein